MTDPPNVASEPYDFRRPYGVTPVAPPPRYGTPAAGFPRDDLSPELESLLGDAQGPASAFDVVRQHVSTYAADYECGVQPAVAQAMAMLADAPEGAAIDLNCGVFAPNGEGSRFAISHYFTGQTA